MEEEVMPVIEHDLEQCYIGIEEGDFHLLEVNKPRIEHYISMLHNFACGNIEEQEREVALQRLQHLQEVSSAMNTVLKEVPSPGVFDDVKLPMHVESAIRLRRLGMPWAKIAATFGFSRQTMYNIRIKYGIEEPNRDVDDEELQDLVLRFTLAKPKAGSVYLKGALLAIGVRASMKRIKQNLRLVDPQGVLLRRRQRIYRRTFKVPGANFLWCIDSNHKNIMFRLVLHGCIDAYSRKLIYLRVASNNLARTVRSFFEDGVSDNGVPKRVRGDKGVENVQVKAFMEMQRPESAHPFIQGRSVHNTRIERLWRETNRHISYPYKTLFLYLEDKGVLDEHDEVDLLCLNYVFLPRIQQDLNDFVYMWNYHPMTKLKGRIPLLAWELNMAQQSMSSDDDEGGDFDDCFDDDNYALDCSDDEDDGGDGNCSINHDDGYETDNGVVVPEYSSISCEPLLNVLSEIVPDPLADDGNDGIELYCEARSVLHDIVRREGGLRL